MERNVEKTLLFFYCSQFCIALGKKFLKKLCQRNNKKPQLFLSLSLLFLILVKRNPEKPQSLTQGTAQQTLFSVTDNWVLVLHFKHTKWKLINGDIPGATSEQGHGLRRIWIRCRKSDSIQQTHCTKSSRPSCTDMFNVFPDTEGATTSYYMWPSLLQRVHRSTDKWKVI